MYSPEEVQEIKHQQVLKLAQSFLWRAEVSPLQFNATLDVLEALGVIDSNDILSIQDDIAELYPPKNEAPNG